MKIVVIDRYNETIIGIANTLDEAENLLIEYCENNTEIDGDEIGVYQLTHDVKVNRRVTFTKVKS